MNTHPEVRFNTTDQLYSHSTPTHDFYLSANVRTSSRSYQESARYESSVFSFHNSIALLKQYTLGKNSQSKDLLNIKCCSYIARQCQIVRYLLWWRWIFLQRAATNIFPRLLQTQSWAVFQFARMSSSLSPLLLLPSFPFSPRSSTTHCSPSTALKYSQVAAQRCAAQLSDIQK